MRYKKLDTTNFSDQAVMGKKRVSLKKIVFVLMTNFAIFIVIDLTLGFFLIDWCFRPSLVVEKHPVLGFRKTPYGKKSVKFLEYPGGKFEIRYNGQALRADRDYAKVKPSDTYRLVIVGDSHTEGFLANNDSYPSQLEKLLAGTVQKHVEVINGGHGRYSPYQAYLRLEHVLADFNPDLVVVAIYIGNDFLDMLRFDDRPSLIITDKGISKRPPQYVIYSDPPFKPWLNHSLIYHFYRSIIKYKLDRVLVSWNIISSFGGGLSETIDFLVSFNKCNNRAIISQSLVQTAYFKGYSKAREKAVKLMEYVINLHKKLATERGYELQFLLIPTRLQIEMNLDRQRLDNAFEAFKLGPADMYMDEQLYDELVLLLNRLDVTFTDARNTLREEAMKGKPLYWNADYHINPKGCEVIAKALKKDLSSRFENGKIN